MKYRIIQESNGNGVTHYEAELWVKNRFCRSRWEPITRYRHNDFDGYHTTAKYDTFEEAMDAIRKRKITRVVCHESEV